MKQYDFTKEEINFIIDRLKELDMLDIIKDVFVNNVPPVQTTNQEPKEKKLHKYRLFSAYGESLGWIEITDEQIRLLEYLQSNDLLGDEVDFEECEAANFKRI